MNTFVKEIVQTLESKTLMDLEAVKNLMTLYDNFPIPG